MSFDLQIGSDLLRTGDLLPLLAQYQLLPKLTQEMLIDRAIAEIPCTPEETANAVAALCQQNQWPSPLEARTVLAKQGIPPEQLELLAVRNLKIERFKQENFAKKLEAYFLQRKSGLDQVIYSIIRTRDVGIAQELYFRIEDNPEEFASLAEQYSQGPEAQMGGRIGPQALEMPAPALARLLAVSQPGQLWPPTRIGEWLVIVRLEQLIPAQLNPAMEQRLMGELFNQWLQEQLKTVTLVPQMAPLIPRESPAPEG